MGFTFKTRITLLSRCTLIIDKTSNFILSTKVHEEGEKVEFYVQIYPFYYLHTEEQPSLSKVLPSSHSLYILTPSPHRSMHLLYFN